MHKAKPIVTGVSPLEGCPGTKIKIRGENLGTSRLDIKSVKICGVECVLSVEWKSSKHLIALSGNGYGKGDIAVTTVAGGVGTCTVGFIGRKPKQGLLDECAVYVDEKHLELYHVGKAKRIMAPQENLDNPLGLSDEPGSKTGNEELMERFSGKSQSFDDENYSPVLYLLSNFQRVSMYDLRQGSLSLKEKCGRTGSATHNYLKNNLSSFISAQDALEKVLTSIKDDTETQGSMMTQLTKILEGIESEIKKLFDPVLKRQHESDTGRSVLNVLQRLKSFFILPSNIESNRKKGNFELVVADYMKAKALLPTVDVPIFKTVYAEVQHQVSEVRNILKHKLFGFPISLEEQKRIIKLLKSLDEPGDPARVCWLKEHEWLIGLMFKVKTNYLSQETADSKKSPSQTELPSPSDHGTKRILFVEELTEHFLEHFPTIYSLMIIYASKKDDIGDDTSRDKVVEDFKEKSFEVVKTYSMLISAALLPTALENLKPKEQEKYGIWPTFSSDAVGAWLTQAVRCVRLCGIKLLELFPKKIQENIQRTIRDLSTNIREYCVRQLLQKAISDISHLYQRETWEIAGEDEDGAITKSPKQFEGIVSDTVQLVKDVLTDSKQLGEDLASQVDVQKKVVELSQKLVAAYAVNLEQQAAKLRASSTKRESPRKGEAIEPPSQTKMTKTKKIVICLGNCVYCRTTLVSPLVDLLSKTMCPSAKSFEATVIKRYIVLEEKLFTQYFDQITEPLIRAIEQGMYVGRFDWVECPKPTGARNYVKRTLIEMVAIYSEVNSISPPFRDQIIGRLTERVAEEMNRLFALVPKFSRAGALQARLDLGLLRKTLGYYETETSRNALQEAETSIPKLEQEDQLRLSELLSKVCSSMKLQLCCFLTRRDKVTPRTAVANKGMRKSVITSKSFQS